MDCRVASLLAMTAKHVVTISPRIAPEPLQNSPPLEGVGNAGCPMHPQPVCKKVHTVVTTVAPESPGIPAREWF
jgi:hypothetical protein